MQTQEMEPCARLEPKQENMIRTMVLARTQVQGTEAEQKTYPCQSLEETMLQLMCPETELARMPHGMIGGSSQQVRLCAGTMLMSLERFLQTRELAMLLLSRDRRDADLCPRSEKRNLQSQNDCRAQTHWVNSVYAVRNQ